MDKLTLEREVALLQCTWDASLFDEMRQKFILLSQEEQIKKHFDRIESLENFIIEQDEVSSASGPATKIRTSHWHYCSMAVIGVKRRR